MDHLYLTRLLGLVSRARFTAWAPFDKDVDILLPKLAWAGVQLLGVAMGVYRLGTMGLLPLTSADWISMLTVKQVGCMAACHPRLTLRSHARHCVPQRSFARLCDVRPPKCPWRVPPSRYDGLCAALPVGVI